MHSFFVCEIIVISEIRRVEAPSFKASIKKSTIFWDIMPCSLLKVNRRFGRTYRLHLQGRRIRQAREELCLPYAFTVLSCSAYSSTLKMEAICSSETSVGFQRTTWRYIPEDSTLHIHRCENLKSYRHKEASQRIVSFVL
jgi:hypothetical protein